MGNRKRYFCDKNKLLLLGGILHSSRAFIGPEVLHIDLTNVCNFNCIACWCRSPLLGDKTMPEWEKKLSLDLNVLKGVFDDLTRMGGLKQVKLVGGGEPFLHKDIMEVIKCIKDKDRRIEIDINTNFSLVDEATADRLIALGVDSFTVSLWAGSAQAYVATHPNQREETFFRIKRVLSYIARRKKELAQQAPRIKIHNVIMKLNYKDFSQMVRFALEVGADDIQFVPIDIVKGKTESLLPDEGQRKELLNDLRQIRRHYDPRTFTYAPAQGQTITLSDFDGFIHRIEKLDSSSGAYDEDRVELLPCYVGWLFARIMATGDVVPCCKGHRMILGNILKHRFKTIWNSRRYREFRYKAKRHEKTDGYFSRIGNDGSKKTGCYNCDNLWQNYPVHKALVSLKGDLKQFFLPRWR